MHLEGEVRIEAPRETVWEFVTDPDKVAACAPGVESMEVVVPDEHFKAIASVGFGAVKTTFSADVRLTELDQPNQATIKINATAPGSVVEASSTMTLSEAGDESTEMKWTADVNIMGTIATLATRMMGGLTKRMSAEFFDCMKAQIEQ